MKDFKSLIAVLILIFLNTPLLSQDAFEGIVEYKISSGDEVTVLNYFVKDNMMKMDVKTGETASIIFNTKDQTMIVMMPDQQMYMEMPIKMHAEKLEKFEKAEGEFRQTGETKEILGYESEKWIYKDDETEVESWMTKELGSFMFMADPMEQSAKPGWQKRLEEGGYFPLSVIIKEISDGTETRMDVTSVEKKSLDSEMFAPPANYQKLDIPGMQK